MKKAFTLAEILIVLSVIAIITAILLPAARNAMPNEDIVKFKKTHNAITTAIREMVNSDKYFLDGDLTKKIDGSEANTCYQANVLADILNAQVLECDDTTTVYGLCIEVEDEIDEIKNADTCHGNYTIIGTVLMPYVGHLSRSVIKLSDNVFISYLPPVGSCNDSKGFNASYGMIHIMQNEVNFDMDNDGIINNGDVMIIAQNCANETEDKIETFAYLVRSDGKIITSSKVDEWLEKSIQTKD